MRSGWIVLRKRVVCLPKNKINLLILLAVFFSSLTMILYAYRSYSNQAIGQTIIFILLFIFFLGLVILGIVRNNKIDKDS